MADGVDLRGLALRIASSAVLAPISLSGHSVASLPEIRRAGLIRDARDHAAFLAAFDFPECLAPELEVVSLLVYGVTTAPVDQYTVVNAADQILQAGARGTCL